MAISVASALVSSRLDYANSVLFGCPQKQLVSNAYDKYLPKS